MSSFKKFVHYYQANLAVSLHGLDADAIEKAVNTLWSAYQKDKQIFICGNGGPAALSAYIASDIARGTAIRGRRKFRLIGLTENGPLLRVRSDNAGPAGCFKEQLENLLKRGDVVVGISVSGDPENIARAFGYARSRGATTIGIAGSGGGKLEKLADITISISSREYEIVEDIQLCLGHIIKRALQEFLKYDKSKRIRKQPLPVSTHR